MHQGVQPARAGAFFSLLLLLLLLLIYLLLELSVMSSSSPLQYENFLQSMYPDLNLPPLWEVLYHEAVRGNHMLFRKSDVELFELESEDMDFLSDELMSEELELGALKVIGCPDLQAMIAVIDAMPYGARRNLYFMYRRVLWMWKNYVKEKMN